MARRNETEEERAARKAATKAAKAEKRAERQGLGDASKGRKTCTLCTRPRDLLIRCQVDATGTWHMVCGKCWVAASGGAVDGTADRPYYRYGGLWKNHHKQGSGRNKVPAAAARAAGRSDARGRGSSGASCGGGGDDGGMGGSRGDSGESGSEAEVEAGERERAGGGGGGGGQGAGCGVGQSAVQAMLLREAMLCEEEED